MYDNGGYRMETPETLLTVQEVAERLKLHRNTVRDYLRRGRLEGLKLSGRTWRISELALQRFLAQSTTAVQITDDEVPF
jgi:excisionase family DNA binding protein